METYHHLANFIKAQDTSLYGSFLENHDVERFAYFTKDMASNRDGSHTLYQKLTRHYRLQSLAKNVSDP